MITSTKITRIQDKIKSMIKEIEKEEEVKITFGTCRYSASEYNSTMKVVTNSNDETTLIQNSLGSLSSPGFDDQATERGNFK